MRSNPFGAQKPYYTIYDDLPVLIEIENHYGKFRSFSCVPFWRTRDIHRVPRVLGDNLKWVSFKVNLGCFSIDGTLPSSSGYHPAFLLVDEKKQVYIDALGSEWNTNYYDGWDPIKHIHGLFFEIDGDRYVIDKPSPLPFLYLDAVIQKYLECIRKSSHGFYTGRSYESSVQSIDVFDGLHYCVGRYLWDRVIGEVIGINGQTYELSHFKLLDTYKSLLNDGTKFATRLESLQTDDPRHPRLVEKAWERVRRRMDKLSRSDEI